MSQNSHHVFSYASYKGVLDITKGEGPAILMSKEDHQKTASYAGGTGSYQREFREKQSALLNDGMYRDAWSMDVASTSAAFGKKYDVSYVMAEKQLLALEKEGKIALEATFKKEIEERQKHLADLEKAQAEKNLAEKRLVELKEKEELQKSEKLKLEKEAQEAIAKAEIQEKEAKEKISQSLEKSLNAKELEQRREAEKARQAQELEKQTIKEKQERELATEKLAIEKQEAMTAAEKQAAEIAKQAAVQPQKATVAEEVNKAPPPPAPEIPPHQPPVSPPAPEVESPKQDSYTRQFDYDLGFEK